MGSELLADGLDLLDDIIHARDACALGNFVHVPGWKGRCIGDCAATISARVLRVVAFQVAGRIGEINEWVSNAVLQLVRSGAHVGVFTETRVQTQDRHTRIVNAFKRLGYLAISHNASPTVGYSTLDTLDEATLGPLAAGVIVVVTESYASGWTDIAYDASGRAIAANLNMSDGFTVRVIGTYGVSGSNCTNVTSFSGTVIAE